MSSLLNLKQRLILGDALFNLPAFLTADLWSKNGGRTYLYRFDHVGKALKAHHFLKGVPIIGNVSEGKNKLLYKQFFFIFETNCNKIAGLGNIIGHGDELSYLFEARNLDGSQINEKETLTDEDVKVRDLFTQMISDFARNGKITLGNENVPNFSSEANNFLQITAQPKVANNFRYCEMALWAGLAQRLQSSTCQFLNIIDSSIKGVQNVFFDTIASPKSQVEQLNTGVKKTGEALTNVFKNPLNMLQPKGKSKTFGIL